MKATTLRPLPISERACCSSNPWCRSVGVSVCGQSVSERARPKLLTRVTPKKIRSDDSRTRHCRRVFIPGLITRILDPDVAVMAGSTTSPLPGEHPFGTSPISDSPTIAHFPGGFNWVGFFNEVSLFDNGVQGSSKHNAAARRRAEHTDASLKSVGVCAEKEPPKWSVVIPNTVKVGRLERFIFLTPSRRNHNARILRP